MFRALIVLALSCLLSPAFADERAQTQQQLDATRQDIAELKKMLGKLQEEKSGVQKDLRSTETDIGKRGKAGGGPATRTKKDRRRTGAP
ncbi:UNVERIFIED_ORG: septal ring factor EnvC (AmiA/AmiB activator) [Pseudomonas vranovensis]|nr:septal ring factor EnvC (AmiA/AmiB activator) [Pseudomonas vranovensis]